MRRIHFDNKNFSIQFCIQFLKSNTPLSFFLIKCDVVYMKALFLKIDKTNSYERLDVVV